MPFQGLLSRKFRGHSKEGEEVRGSVGRKREKRGERVLDHSSETGRQHLHDDKREEIRLSKKSSLLLKASGPESFS